MLAWTAYLLVVSGILSLAALSLERAIRPYAIATRWVWISALFGSLLLPLILSATATRTAIRIAATGSLPERAPQVWKATAPSESAISPDRPADFAPARLDALVAAVWALSSGIAAAVLLGGWAHGHRRRRRWRPASVAGTELLLSKDAGPATVGLLRPQIVLPEWLLAAAPEALLLVIAHERSHVEARDPGLLGLGLCVAILMPWNGLVWWQVRRLRLAIEVDCDRRVLRVCQDARRYARTLVDVSIRRPAYLGGLAASPKSLSAIERRIIIMMTPRIHGLRASTAACTLLAAGIATAILLISPPAIPPAVASINRAVEQTGLDRYVGSYEFSTITVLQIGLRDGQLTATWPGAKPQPLTRESDRTFRFGTVDAHIRFAMDPAGQVTGLVLVQNGAATEAPRIGTGRAQVVSGVIRARVRAQAATPGSEAALRALILGIESGEPDYGELSPQLAAGTRALLPRLQAELKPLGPLRSIEFRGIDSKGWDQYLVRFQRGTASCGIGVDSYGLIVGAGVATHRD